MYMHAFVNNVSAGRGDKVYVSSDLCGGAPKGENISALSCVVNPYHLYFTPSGDMLVSDNQYAVIRKIDANGIMTTIAGQSGSNKASADGLFAYKTTLYSPYGMVMNSRGDIFICEANGNKVKKISVDDGKLYTVVGSSTATTCVDGGNSTSSTCGLNFPSGIAIGPDDSIYIADYQNNMIRQVVDTTVNIIAGTGTSGSSADGSIAKSNIKGPYEVAFFNGTVYFSETNQIRKIVDGKLVTVAGTGGFGSSGDGGNATKALFKRIVSFSIEPNTGDIYIADAGGFNIRKVFAAYGNITTIAGSSSSSGTSGDGGLAINAKFTSPTSVAVGPDGRVYIADNYRIRVIDQNGIINRYAGDAEAGNGYNNKLVACTAQSTPLLKDGVLTFTQNIVKQIGSDGIMRFPTIPDNSVLGIGASIISASGVSINSLNELHVIYNKLALGKVANNTFVRISGYKDLSGFSGDGFHSKYALLNNPNHIFINKAGEMIITDTKNHKIRKVFTNGTIITVAGNGLTTTPPADNVLATLSSLNSPTCTIQNELGELYIADTLNNRIRKVLTNGIIITIAGTGSASSTGDGGLATAATFNQPFAIALSPSDELYISDQGNHRIRKISKVDGKISTIAGIVAIPNAGSSGDGGLATSAKLNQPYGIAFSPTGELYIADGINSKIRKIGLDGIITAIAGTGSGTFSGDNDLASKAALNRPIHLTFTPNGDLYVADAYNYRVRKIDNTTGIITTVVGKGSESNFYGNGLAPTSAAVQLVYAVAFDLDGSLIACETGAHRIRKVVNNNTALITTIGAFGGPDAYSTRFFSDSFQIVGDDIYFADTTNYLIRKIDSKTGMVNTVAGNGYVGYSGDGGLATDAKIEPQSMAVSPSGEIYFTDSNRHIVRKIFLNGTIATIAGKLGVQSYSGDGGPSYLATLTLPKGISVNSLNEVFIIDANQRVRKIDANGTISTIPSSNLFSNPLYVTATETDIFVGDMSDRIKKVSLQCSNGYYGSDCMSFNCNNLPVDNVNVCSGAGKCIEYNTCSCPLGISGQYCEYFSCNGVLSSNSSVCSSHGICSSLNNCTCDTGFYGSNCEEVECFGIRSFNSSVCSSNGICLATDQCNCTSSFYRNDCSEFNCFEIHRNNETVCNGRGKCSGPDSCSCDVEYYGDQCDEFDCFGVKFSETNVCSGKGSCVGPNNCSCSDGFYGSNCSKFDCFGVESTSSVCNMHGSCLGPNNCSCSNGYYGNQCEKFDCFGVNSLNSTFTCSGNGKCVSFNNCSCNEGYTGQTCSGYSCFGLLSNNSNVCNGRGSCNYYNNCSCSNNYYGNECEQFNCFGTPKDNPLVCSAAGVCNSPNNCTCKLGYYGHDCSQFDCFDINYSEAKVCSGRGSCLSPNNCSCLDGFSGSNCSKLDCVSGNCSCSDGYFGEKCQSFTCFGVLYSKDGVCSSNGDCVSPDNCSCLEGFYGRECEKFDCFGVNSLNTTFTCNGNGNCTGPNECKCNSVYTGVDCSSKKTENSTSNPEPVVTCFGKLANDSSVCSGNGECAKLDTCQCRSTANLHINGTNCDIISCRGPDNVFYSHTDSQVCSGHGNCSILEGGCSCAKGYQGDYCQTFTCNNVLSSSAGVCSGHGSCIDYNICNCKQDSTNGYWTGTNCEKCSPGYESEQTGCKTKGCDPVSTCNSHGKCNSTTLECSCDGNWKGADCSQCKTNYFGSNCEKYCEKSNNCSSHGLCLFDGSCSCYNDNQNGFFDGERCEKCKDGYHGSECSTQIIGPVKFLNMFNGIKLSLFGPNSYSLNSIDCSRLIGSRDLIKFGTGPICSWTNKQNGEFTILFGEDFTLSMNETIQLSYNVFETLNSENLVSLTVQNAENPITPIASMTGKQILSSCETISIDASSSFSGDRKPLIYHWSIVYSPIPMETLTNYGSVSKIELNSTGAGNYVFALRVQSSISGQFSEITTFNITKFEFPLPSVSIASLSSQIVTSQSLPIILYKVISIPDCFYSNQLMKVEWKQTNGPETEAEIDSNNNLAIKKFSKIGEYTYTFQVKVISYFNPQSFAINSISFTTEANPLQLSIYSSSVSKTEANIAIEYIDPDGTNENEVWTWSCVNLSNNNGNCGNSIATLLTSVNQPLVSLALPSTDYLSSTGTNPTLRVSLSITKGSRSQSSFTDFTFPNKEIIPPIINLINYYPSNILTILKNSDIISIDLDVSANGQKIDIEKYITRVWKLNQVVLTLPNPLLNRMSELTNSIIIDPKTLNEGSTYEVSLTVTDSRLPSQPSTFSQKFTIAKSPQACKCSISPQTGYAMETPFTFSCVNCQNEQSSLQLSYGFVYQDSTELSVVLYTSTSSYTTKLPLIKSAFVKITDSSTNSYTIVNLSPNVLTPLAKSIIEAKKKSVDWANYAKTLKYGDPNTLVFNSKTINTCLLAMYATVNARRSLMTVNCQNGNIDKDGNCKCLAGYAKIDCSLSLQDFENNQEFRMKLMNNTISLYNERNPDEIMTEQFLVLQMMIIDTIFEEFDEINDFIVVNSLRILNQLFEKSLLATKLNVSNSFDIIFSRIMNYLMKYMKYKNVDEIKGNEVPIQQLSTDASKIMLKGRFVGEREILFSTGDSIIVSNKLYRNMYSSLIISDQRNSSLSLPSSAPNYLTEKSFRKPIPYFISFKDTSFDSVSSISQQNGNITKIRTRSISRSIGLLNSIFETLSDSPTLYKFQLDGKYSLNRTDIVTKTIEKLENTTTYTNTFESFKYFCATPQNISHVNKVEFCKLEIKDSYGSCICLDTSQHYMIVEEATIRTEIQIIIENLPTPSTPSNSSAVENPGSGSIDAYSLNIAAIIVPIVVGSFIICLAIATSCLVFKLVSKRRKAANASLKSGQVELATV